MEIRRADRGRSARNRTNGAVTVRIRENLITLSVSKASLMTSS